MVYPLLAMGAVPINVNCIIWPFPGILSSRDTPEDDKTLEIMLLFFPRFQWATFAFSSTMQGKCIPDQYS